MIRFNESEPIELMSRLGRVGTARSFDLWQFRESVEQAVEGVAQIASLSYGNEEAKNPQKLFARIVEKQHLSCLEFIPFLSTAGTEALPFCSARNQLEIGAEGLEEYRHLFSPELAEEGRRKRPATGFLIEDPIFVARQWMRHRALSELELSRRFVLGSKISFTFYGQYSDDKFSRLIMQAHEYSLYIYDKLVDMKCPAELARSVIGTGAMTQYFSGAYNDDWRDSFVKLRSDLHAQPEIRVFSDLIKEVVK